MQSFWPRNGHIDGMSYGFETWTVCHIRHTGIYEHHCDNECGKPNLVYFWNSSRINGISLADNWYGLACGSQNWPSRWTFSDNVGTWNGTRWHFKCIINVINGIAISILLTKIPAILCEYEYEPRTLLYTQIVYYTLRICMGMFFSIEGPSFFLHSYPDCPTDRHLRFGNFHRQKCSASFRPHILDLSTQPYTPLQKKWTWVWVICY